MSDKTGSFSHNEVIKDANPSLAGEIAPTLNDSAVDAFSKDDQQFLKFHGIYQQDDRDVRKQGKKFIFMIRGVNPGGVLAPELYLTYDRLSEEYGNQTLRITSRQSFQFHGVVKSGLGALMKGINDALATTLAACGDVNRNVMAPPTPARNGVATAVLDGARTVSQALMPRTKAYHQIWVEGVKLKLDDSDYVDPLYGKTYLPRKFKVAFVTPPLNDTDVLTNCMGFIAIEENGELIGYNLTAGGGMGMTHNKPETYPRVADVIGFFTPEHLEAVSKAVLTVHRDFGDRTDRRHARLKYVLAERGVDWFRGEVEQRAGIKLEAVRPFEFERQGDLFGWHEAADGSWFLGLHVLAGRVKGGLKTALREIVETHRPEVRLTPSQNLLLCGVASEDIDKINSILLANGVAVEETEQGTLLQRGAMACPALPTCGLSLAESERYLPEFLGVVEDVLAGEGLADEQIIVRMTGCPNGCARPYMAELGIVGRSPGKYAVYLGGNADSTRLGRLYNQNVKVDEMKATLGPIVARFKNEREAGEGFGDFCARTIWPEQEVAE
jgi:sulfite reductase (NADPH) hemoprotein beta-component